MADGFHPFLSSAAHAQGLRTCAGVRPCGSVTRCRRHPGFAPAPRSQLSSHRTSTAVKYGPSWGAALIHHLSSSLCPLFFCPLWPLIAFREFIILNFYPFPGNPIFFSSLLQLINNRESTSLDRSISCLLKRTAGVSLLGSSWACEGHITCHPRESILVQQCGWEKGANGVLIM